MIKPLSQCANAKEFLESLRAMSKDSRYISDRPYIDYWILNGQDVEQVYEFGLKRHFTRNMQTYVSGNRRGGTIPDRDIPAYDWMLGQLGVAK